MTPLIIRSKNAAVVHLTKGYHALVDPENWPRITKRRWHVVINNGRVHYAQTGIRVGKKTITVLMHRDIMPTELEIDHINCNTLDNRKCNLRSATRSQNMRNTRKRFSPTTSQYKGVSWDECRNLWRAVIQLDNHQYIGRFSTEIEAARAYDGHARKLYGEFANLNFPNEIHQPYCPPLTTSDSGYRGVYLRKKKYLACVQVNGKQVRLGLFKTPLEAAKCYDKKAPAFLGERMRYNFAA